jgi:hypothetical protein
MAVMVGDAASDGGRRAQDALADLGPGLLAALQALGATPAARKAAPGGVRGAVGAPRAAAAAKRAPAAAAEAPEDDEDADDGLPEDERRAIAVLEELRSRRAVTA